MGTKVVLAVLVLCAVCVNSDDFYGRSNRLPEYVKIKRAKYYSNPLRFYRRPPIFHPVKGLFSYTSPPNFMNQDDPYPGIVIPKVSKRPANDGLEDEDLNNIVKHLSKQDLDKIIDFTGEKYKDNSFNKYSTSSKEVPREISDVSVYKSPAHESSTDQKFSLNGPYVSNNNYDMEYADNSRPPVNNIFKATPETEIFSYKGDLSSMYQDINQFNNIQNTIQQQAYQSTPFRASPQDMTDVPLNVDESMHNKQFSFLNGYIQQEIQDGTPGTGVSAFTDSRTSQEEQLPKPVNLREELDYEVANTNYAPSFLKATSYKVENFGDLPLMDYSSKLDTVSSYHVPHYTVISPSARQPQPPPSYASQPSYASSSSQLVSSPSAAAIKVPMLEPAPPKTAARDQSDAHLRATKIWAHKSRGTAYTLHDDGTLSLEKPGRPKTVYGQ